MTHPSIPLIVLLVVVSALLLVVLFAPWVDRAWKSRRLRRQMLADVEAHANRGLAARPDDVRPGLVEPGESDD